MGEKITYESFLIKFSYDSSAWVVKYTLVPERKRDAAGGDVIGIHVFDANLQEKWAKRVTMPYPEKKMNTLDYSVDAGGNVYIMAQVFGDGKKIPKTNTARQAIKSNC